MDDPVFVKRDGGMDLLGAFLKIVQIQYENKQSKPIEKEKECLDKSEPPQNP